MNIFNLLKPRTSRGGALFREKELMKKLGKLLEAKDERTFMQGLKEDFGITKGHENYDAMLTIWREQK